MSTELESTARMPKIPLGLKFNPYTVNRIPHSLVSQQQKMQMVKGYFIGQYNANFFLKCRRSDYLAPRAAFACFFAHTEMKKTDDEVLYGVPLNVMGRIMGDFDHSTILHHIKNHDNNMADFYSTFGEYYRDYYKLTSLIYNGMFEPSPRSIVEKRMLIGAF
jgi:hypothetical protein